MRKLTNQEKVVIPLLFSAGLWAYWNYLYKPLAGEIARLEQDLSEKHAKLESTRKAAEEIHILEAEFEILKLQSQEMEKKLPNKKDLPTLIRNITKSLEKHRINVQRFVPGKESPKKYFSEIPITLQVSGSYHTLANFLAEVGQYERVFNTYDVNLTPKVPSKKSPETVSASLKLKTYMAK